MPEKLDLAAKTNPGENAQANKSHGPPLPHQSDMLGWDSSVVAGASSTKSTGMALKHYRMFWHLLRH